MKKVLSMYAVSLLAVTVYSGSVGASSVSLTPSSQNAKLTDTVNLTLTMDFSDDATIGGGVDLMFDDSMFNFVSFNFAPTLGDEVGLRRLPDLVGGSELNGIGFATSASLGLSGPTTVGTFQFDPIGTGIGVFSLAANDAPYGGFYSANTFDPQTVVFNGATVNVVPELETWAMMAAGIGFMSWKMRRRHESKAKELTPS